MRTIGFFSLLLLSVPAVSVAAEPVLIAKPDAFQTLVNPMCSHCRDEAKRRAGELRDDDRVLCWVRGYSDGGAIPIRFFLNAYRVISDTYGVFVYDPDAGYARGFAPSLEFTFHGWRNGVMVMKHKDGTLYSCLTGVAFERPNKGKKLEPVPTLVSDWGFWLKRYPQNVAYHMFDKYKPIDLPTTAHEDSVKSRGPVDRRLPAETMVLGIVTEKGARAYPLGEIEKTGLLADKMSGEEVVILWHGPTKTAAAYAPLATPPKKGEEKPRPIALGRDDKDPEAPFVDKETGSHWDIAGRAVDGELNGWTLTWLDSVTVKWFAWAADVPQTEVFTSAKSADKMKEIAGSAEFLRNVPKRFARLEALDADKRQVTLLLDGEKLAKVWMVTPDAEVKVAGWWGRLDQFKKGDHVWAWFKLNRDGQAVAVFMLADEASEQDARGKVSDQAEFERRRTAQQKLLVERWSREGLPGQVAFVHISGEMDLLLDHEAMRWGRSLKSGDEVKIAATPPIRAVVKTMTPWRERTQLRLVVNGTEPADLATGQRLNVLMTPPSADILDSQYPSDIGRARSREDRIEWFLASIYCPCKVGNDTCTGQFYTLSSCNPNGCGLPNAVRKQIAAKIDKGLSDRDVFDELLSEHGANILRPHLLP
jgi:hypothetical protein